jgi:hypothetical protein
MDTTEKKVTRMEVARFAKTLRIDENRGAAFFSLNVRLITESMSRTLKNDYNDEQPPINEREGVWSISSYKFFLF